MTRHTLRDLMIGLQGAMACLWVVAAVGGQPATMTVSIATWLAAFILTPSRLPPRNERGQFSKRD